MDKNYIFLISYPYSNLLPYSRPSVISIAVTKGGHLRSSKLYKISKTIR